MSINLQPGEELVIEASFDPALKTYWIVNSIIGIGIFGSTIVFFVALVTWKETGHFAGGGLSGAWSYYSSFSCFPPSGWEPIFERSSVT